MLPIVLASSSPYRRALLEKLGLQFVWAAPAIDERSRTGERPAELAARLAQAKAQALAPRYAQHLIIGSDQVANLEGNAVGKPLTHEIAVRQLLAASGKAVVFETGLCVLNTTTGRADVSVERAIVHFRALTAEQAQRYVAREQPLDCAGSFKAEGLGIALFERIEAEDPNTLIGLPLIRLVSLLDAAGVAVL